jgi:hypothetical protein
MNRFTGMLDRAPKQSLNIDRTRTATTSAAFVLVLLLTQSYLALAAEVCSPPLLPKCTCHNIGQFGLLAVI